MSFKKINNDMITLRPAVETELIRFVAFEKERDVAECIISYSIDQHREYFASDHALYLSIDYNGCLAGFILLFRKGDRIEFRRIVVSRTRRGIGQQVIMKMHAYCAEMLNAKTIWLDVFEHNDRARHIYAKMGYEVTGVSNHEKGKLILMEKDIRNWKHKTF